MTSMLGGLNGIFAPNQQGYFNGIYTGGGLPQYQTNTSPSASQAPTYDLNTLYGNQALNSTIGSGGAGYLMNGLEAFMPRGWSTPQLTSDSGDRSNMQITSGGTFANGPGNAMSDISSLAGALGMNTSGYDLSSPQSQKSIMDPMARPGGIGASQNNLASLYNSMEDSLKNYYAIGGMSSGWDGSGQPRSASQSLYYNDNNVLRPVTDPNQYTAPEKKGGWMQNDGADLMSALSMVMPAFGGWAGILGNGVGGTLSAGSGLGLTGSLGSVIGNGAANLAVNTGVNSALNGGFSPTSFAANLGMNAAGGLMNGGGLSSMFPSQNIGADSYSNLGSLMSTGIGSSIGQMPFFKTPETAGLGSLLGTVGKSTSFTRDS